MTLALLEKPPSAAQFLPIFNRLCVALREPDDNSGVTAGIYFEVLKDLPLPAIAAGAETLMRETGRRFFPTTAEWRTAAERALEHALRQAVKPARDEPWRFECARCLDSGWVVDLTCDGGAAAWPEAVVKQVQGNQKYHGNRRPVGYKAEPRDTETPRAACCGKTTPHLPHTFTKICPCRATNRTFIRNQSFGRGAV